MGPWSIQLLVSVPYVEVPQPKRSHLLGLQVSSCCLVPDPSVRSEYSLLEVIKTVSASVAGMVAFKSIPSAKLVMPLF